MLFVNPLCRRPVSAQLGWTFAPGMEQMCSETQGDGLGHTPWREHLEIAAGV